MAQNVIDSPQQDIAWPSGCSACLWSVACLPHGTIPTSYACRSVEHARQSAEKDCGRHLEWHEGKRRENGQRKFYSNDIPYKGGTLYYAIWC